jgi:beta-lactamase regulating signal transducer with metallopeptidase domain
MTLWLLTWFWQGLALTIVLALALHALPQVNAATRYVLWWCALAAVIFLGWQSLPGSVSTAAISAAAAGSASSESSLALHVRPLPAGVLSLFTIVWMSVGCFRLMQLFPGLSALYRLKDECRQFPASVEAQLPLWLGATGRHARLALCDRLEGAALLGLHEPIIALPASLVGGLSAADLDQIIQHESGHVQRRDDWMRLLQTMIEAAVWIHPATFLIGRQLNLEREVACDDWVVHQTGSPKRYAACLSRVAERRAHTAPAFAQALFGGRRDLVRRINRLVDDRRNRLRRPSLSAAAVGIVAIGACALQLRAFPLVTGPRSAIDRVALSQTGPVAPAPVTSRNAPQGQRAAHTGRALHTASRVRGAVSPPQEARVAPALLDSPDGSVVPAHAESPLVVDTRSFPGVYRSMEGALVPVRAAPWQRAADVGVGIGATAQKAGVGMADALTRAGTAVGRRFQRPAR